MPPWCAPALDLLEGGAESLPLSLAYSCAPRRVLKSPWAPQFGGPLLQSSSTGGLSGTPSQPLLLGRRFSPKLPPYLGVSGRAPDVGGVQESLERREKVSDLGALLEATQILLQRSCPLSAQGPSAQWGWTGIWQWGHDPNLGHAHLAQQGPVALCPTHHSTDPHSQLWAGWRTAWRKMVRPEPSREQPGS